MSTRPHDICEACWEGEHEGCAGYPPCMCIDMEHDQDEDGDG